MTQGFSKALHLFQKSAREIPAYRTFLASHHIKPLSITTEEDFTHLPVMTKKNYLSRSSLKNLFAGGKIPPMICASSGSSGHPTFWFRGDEQEISGAAIHEKIFRDIFGIAKQDETLVIICFSMGIWVAGNYTLAACRELSRQGYQLSTITPGIEITDVLHVLEKIAPQFKNVILAGYPPFVMDIMNQAVQRKIPRHPGLRFITAGDKFTETWRDSLFSMCGIKDPLHSLVSIYGSADAGVLGFETPVSILLRKETLTNKALSADLYGETSDQPALLQYDPNVIFFEEVGGELLFTTNTATPLVRYNIRDTGRIISWNEMRTLLATHGLLAAAEKAGFSKWRIPFIIKYARNDVAVTFYALNIYPENIKTGLEGKSLERLVSGKFFAFNKNTNRQRNQQLCVDVELSANTKPTAKAKNLITRHLTQKLISQNIEYRKLYSILGDKAIPKITLTPFGSHATHHGVRGLTGAKGKKNKIVEA